VALWAWLAAAAFAQTAAVPVPGPSPAAALYAAPDTLAGLADSLDAPSPEPSGLLQPIVDSYLTGLLQHDPELATRYGLHQADSRLTRYDARSIARREAFNERHLRMLEKLPLERLSHDEKIDRLQLLFDLQSQGSWPSIEGVLDAPLSTIELHFLHEHGSERDRLEAALSRFEQYPLILRQGRRTIESASKFERASAKTILPGARQVCEEVAARLLSAFPEQQGRIERAAAAAARELDRFEAFVKTLPVARGGWRAGRPALDEELSRHLVDVDAGDLKHRIDRETRRVLADLREAAGELFPGVHWQEAVRSVTAHPDKERILDEYEGVVRRARAHSNETGVATPTAEELEIHPTPEHQRLELPFAAYEAPLPLDATRKGHLFVTLAPPGASKSKEEEWLRANANFGVIAINAVHEGFPGHHLQMTRTKDDAAPLRRLFWDMFLGEGWAHYIEGVMSDTGFLDADGRLMMLFERRWQLARARATLGLHVEGWSTERATKYIRHALGITRAEAESSVTRYAVLDPVESLAYSMGRVELLALRSRTVQRLGPRFTMREFHDRLLAYGALPLPILEKLLERDWK
jgi:uncharacterized protein (DUF885 family)